MLSSIFIALLQAVTGDPAVNATEAPAAETTAPATTPAPAPRTERRRVCQTNPAATGGRLQARRCRWEDVPVDDASAPEEEPAETHGDHQTGGHANTAPAPTTPQQD